jgi:nicotinamidase-related amidase
LRRRGVETVILAGADTHAAQAAAVTDWEAL